MKELKAYEENGIDSSWYDGWQISEKQRDRYSKLSRASYKAKQKAVHENKIGFYQEINEPRLDPNDLMPRLRKNGLKSLSLFSGGGGLDLGFDRAGFGHAASYEILEFAAESIRRNRPTWKVYSGSEGDVTSVNWDKYKGKVDVVHGGPPCQPFSTAGKQRGKLDPRDMIPEFVRCVNSINPRAFVIENVVGLSSKKFHSYLQQVIWEPLSDEYDIEMFTLNAAGFGVPQIRRRVIFVGIRKESSVKAYQRPLETYDYSHLRKSIKGKTTLDIFTDFLEKEKCLGVRQALGLKDIGFDTIAPTLRCTLTGPRSTTSILSSTSAQKIWTQLGVWPNGVQLSREKASAFETKNGTFRLSVDDCALLQGFPKDWKFNGPVYQALGQIGNSVAPPMAYAIAQSLVSCLER